MTTDRIERLQSLLSRIKRNAALPKQTLGRNFVFGGTRGASSDVSAGPAVPVAAAPASAHADVGVQRPALGPTPSQPRMPLVAVPAQFGGPGDLRRQRSRVPTRMGVAPSDDGDDLDEVSKPASSKPLAPEVASGPVNVGPDGGASMKAPPTNSDIDNLSWSEPPTEETSAPDSSRRERVAATLDEALLGATSDSDSQIPIKTPPPESGRQPTEGVYAAAMPAATDGVAVPTPEQLGETVELEAPTAAEIELDLREPPATKTSEELEVELPVRPSILEPPEVDELTPAPPPGLAHRPPEHSQVLVMPDDVRAVEASDGAKAERDNTLLSGNEELKLVPQVTNSAIVAQQRTIDVLRAAQAFAPRSFLELLDASLALK